MYLRFPFFFSSFLVILCSVFSSLFIDQTTSLYISFLLIGDIISNFEFLIISSNKTSLKCLVNLNYVLIFCHSLNFHFFDNRIRSNIFLKWVNYKLIFVSNRFLIKLKYYLLEKIARLLDITYD